VTVCMTQCQDSCSNQCRHQLHRDAAVGDLHGEVRRDLQRQLYRPGEPRLPGVRTASCTGGCTAACLVDSPGVSSCDFGNGLGSQYVDVDVADLRPAVSGHRKLRQNIKMPRRRVGHLHRVELLGIGALSATGCAGLFPRVRAALCRSAAWLSASAWPSRPRHVVVGLRRNTLHQRGQAFRKPAMAFRMPGHAFRMRAMAFQMPGSRVPNACDGASACHAT